MKRLNKTSKIIELENALQQLEKENMALKTRIEQLQTQLAETDNTMHRAITDFSERLKWLETKAKKKPLQHT